MSLLLIPMAQDSYANPVYGSYDLVDGDIYIPLSPEASGAYGDTTGGGHVIGQDADSVRLLRQYPTSSGFVDLMVGFDISDSIQPGQWVGYDSSLSMWVNFEDLDFKPVEIANVGLREWVEIALLDELGVRVAGANPLVLDTDNYLTYRQDFDGNDMVVETDNVAGTYGDILIRDVFFGGDTADWRNFVNSLNETSEFGMLLTFHTELELLSGRGVTINNTLENMDSTQIVLDNFAPEPGTLTLLSFGGLMMLNRRKRRRT
jgi:hypothetical protein